MSNQLNSTQANGKNVRIHLSMRCDNVTEIMHKEKRFASAHDHTRTKGGTGYVTSVKSNQKVFSSIKNNSVFSEMKIGNPQSRMKIINAEFTSITFNSENWDYVWVFEWHVSAKMLLLWRKQVVLSMYMYLCLSKGILRQIMYEIPCTTF